MLFFILICSSFQLVFCLYFAFEFFTADETRFTPITFLGIFYVLGVVFVVFLVLYCHSNILLARFDIYVTFSCRTFWSTGY